jgi:DNA-directed RNA polymerase beta' subunit
MMKLHHMAEGKSAGRDVGAYTTEGIPAGGGDEGSKRLGFGEMSALVSHGATNLIRDAKVVRGQRNDDYWRALRLGYTPPSPKVPQVYDKFLSMLQASGINLKKKGDVLQLYAMTDDDVDKLSGGPITKADTVTGDKMDPVAGGLFDVGKTGGHGGTRWSHISLAEPMPNPVMEEPIRRILGLTKNQFADVLAGKRQIGEGTGARAIFKALQQLNVDKEIDAAKAQINEGPASKRDAAVKKLGYLEGLKKQELAPAKMMMTKVPVLPPVFRPITAFNNTEITADANMLYLDLLEANEDYGGIKKELGADHAGDERLRLYNSFKAVTGLGDPIGAKSVEKKTKGLLSQIFGGSPKFGMYQRRVLGAAVDTVGRGVITPNPSLNMDQVGMPETKAWTIYRPFVMRQLVRRGMSAMAAKENIEKKSDIARSTLIDQMSKRPVIITRAPVLHRYGVLAAWPVLSKGNTLQIPPIVTPGFNADFDGDAMNYHVPVSDDAVQEAVNKLMPSKNLYAVKDFDVHYTPKQEFLHGLFLASTQKKKGSVKTFRSKQDALNAYKRGEIGLGDQVDVR